MFVSIKRICRLGWKNFKRSGGLSVVAIVVLMMTTFLATSLLLAREVSEEAIEEIEASADISIYFNLATPEDQIQSIAEDLNEEFDLAGINYVSRHEALEDFRARHGDNEVLMAALDEVGNRFSATLDVKAGDVSDYRAISDYARSNYSEVIDEIDFYRRKEAIESIFAITGRIQRSLIVLGGILALVSIFIVFGTVRLSIYSLNKEIKVMKLVGASNGFMQGSFIIQGFILGLIASVLSLITLFGLALLMHQGYNVFGISLESHIMDNLSFILLLQLSTGIGLSVISSFVAVRKYLKV